MLLISSENFITADSRVTTRSYSTSKLGGVSNPAHKASYDILQGVNLLSLARRTGGFHQILSSKTPKITCKDAICLDSVPLRFVTRRNSVETVNDFEKSKVGGWVAIIHISAFYEMTFENKIRLLVFLVQLVCDGEPDLLVSVEIVPDSDIPGHLDKKT